METQGTPTVYDIRWVLCARSVGKYNWVKQLTVVSWKSNQKRTSRKRGWSSVWKAEKSGKITQDNFTCHCHGH